MLAIKEVSKDWNHSEYVLWPQKIKLEINKKKKVEIPQMLGNLAIYF